MATAEPCETFDEAMTLLAATLNGVENEFTSILFDPSQWQNDGRMYPPQSDNARSVAGRDDVTRFRSVRHNTWVSTYGAILIKTDDGQVLLDKPGRNLRRVEL
jgi:hypothetical protein